MTVVGDRVGGEVPADILPGLVSAVRAMHPAAAHARRDEAVVLLAGMAGLRARELSRLRISSIVRSDPQARAFREWVHKASTTGVRVVDERGRRRVIPLAYPVAAAVTTWLAVRPDAPTDHLFVAMSRARPRPTPLMMPDVRRILSRAARRSGHEPDTVTFDALRHRFRVHQVRARTPSKIIDVLMG